MRECLVVTRHPSATARDKVGEPGLVGAEVTKEEAGSLQKKDMMGNPALVQMLLVSR